MNFLDEKEAKEDDPHFGEGLPEDFTDASSDAFDLALDPQCLDLQVADAKLGLFGVLENKTRKHK